jgi:hypothetical protein
MLLTQGLVGLEKREREKGDKKKRKRREYNES